MKRIVSLLTVLVMAATIISFPTVNPVYATDDASVVENIIEENELKGDDIETPGENIEEPEEQKTDLNSEDVKVTVKTTKYTYTGKAIKPVPVVTYNNETLVKDTDYKVSYKNNINAGKAAVIITAIGEKYTGTRTQNFTITKKSLSDAAVTLKYSNYSYRNQDRKPTPTVSLNDKTLVKNEDYTVSYSNNRYPGTANVTIKGTGNYSGTVNKTFDIAKMGALSLESRGASSVKVSWDKKDNVTGYQIYIYDEDDGEWVWKKTVKGADNTKTTISDLEESSRHKMKIRAYVKDEDGYLHRGNFGPAISMTTKPGKVTISKFSTNSKMKLTVKWNKENCSGYQIALSRNSKFSDPAKYTIKSPDTLSKTIQASKNKKYYYVKVRAYRYINGKKVYGKWSSVKKVKTYGKGWVNVNGRKYYYRNGTKLKGKHSIGGSSYFFGRNSGVLIGTDYYMYSKIKNEKSRTKYLIAVSRTKNRLCVYEKNDGEWVVKYYWKCSTGAPGLISPVSKTPAGSYYVPKKTTRKLHFGESHGYTCWYATRIKNAYYFHSVKYKPYSKTELVDGRLGYNVSAGCVRLKMENAKWIYDNIKAGTKVVILAK